ncbi:hypothetical protein Lesp02_55150 [Lentzea sp. NBRC 105346]|nr:hypothetical protein Lesp02_55150 [Lentzea sp. NBRC 105346]
MAQIYRKITIKRPTPQWRPLSGENKSTELQPPHPSHARNRTERTQVWTGSGPTTKANHRIGTLAFSRTTGALAPGVRENANVSRRSRVQSKQTTVKCEQLVSRP